MLWSKHIIILKILLILPSSHKGLKLGIFRDVKNHEMSPKISFIVVINIVDCRCPYRSNLKNNQLIASYFKMLLPKIEVENFNI